MGFWQLLLHVFEPFYQQVLESENIITSVNICDYLVTRCVDYMASVTKSKVKDVLLSYCWLLPPLRKIES